MNEEETQTESIILLLSEKGLAPRLQENDHYPVTNLGTLTISKGTFRTTAAMEKSITGNFLITNRSTLTVTGGTFTGKKHAPI